MTRVRVPQLQNIPDAIRIFYEKHELTNKDIRELFGCCSTTAYRLKEMAKEKMGEDVPIWNALAVNTENAYRAWGIEIEDLERRYQKLRKYGMVNNEKPNNRTIARDTEGMPELSAPQAALPHMV